MLLPPPTTYATASSDNLCRCLLQQPMPLRPPTTYADASNNGAAASSGIEAASSSNQCRFLQQMKLLHPLTTYPAESSNE